MNAKSLLIVILVAAGIVAVVAWFSYKNPATTNDNGDASGLFVSANAIYVADQEPAATVSVAVARLDQPGFVAIHEDADGEPGKILGASGLLPAGETEDSPAISLSRSTTDGETLYAVLYLDDGDGKFDEAKDAPALDATGGEAVMMEFFISADATEPGAVNP